MHRFFVKEKAIEGKVVKVTGSDFNHISHSLRLQSGEHFIVSTGDGMDHIVEIENISDDTVYTRIKESHKNKNEPDIKISLAQAVPKKNNMDLIIQKSTEIGINKIIPIHTERTIVKLDEKKLVKRKIRWQKIAEEAAKQSGRGIIPLVEDLYDLKTLDSVFNEYDLVLIPWVEEDNKNLKTIWQETEDGKKNKILIIIGPEGGFSIDEIDLVKKHKGKSVTLGPRILRTETAGFVALTAILFQAGELGG